MGSASLPVLRRRGTAFSNLERGPSRRSLPSEKRSITPGALEVAGDGFDAAQGNVLSTFVAVDGIKVLKKQCLDLGVALWMPRGTERRAVDAARDDHTGALAAQARFRKGQARRGSFRNTGTNHLL